MAIPAETQFHVLAIDDSLIYRKLIERVLKTSSYQVTAMDSGSKVWNSWAYMMNREPHLLDLQKVRCLEDGAEEFLLKPVRLSDVNRLRPYILKGKSKEEQQQQQQQQ